jgi:hypothetical protein
VEGLTGYRNPWLLREERSSSGCSRAPRTGVEVDVGPVGFWPGQGSRESEQGALLIRLHVRTEEPRQSWTRALRSRAWREHRRRSVQ